MSTTNESNSKTWVRLEFLTRLQQDREAGCVRPLGEYLAEFPREATVITEEYERAVTLRQPRAMGEGQVERVGPYRLVGVLGQGGQASVYRARDERLGRDVALKVIEASAFNPESRARLRREAEIASRLHHPGICTIHEFGEDGDVAYVAMSLEDGQPLSEILGSAMAPSSDGLEGSGSRERSRSVTLPDLWPRVALIEEVARALHVAHERGLVHRDVEPSNIMVRPDGRPVVLDFGLARPAEGDDAALTRTGDVVGTPAYLSPEQVRAQRLDRRTDVWALGVTLYEVLAGRRPFRGASRIERFDAILHQSPVSLRRLNPSVPPDLAVVVGKALEKNADHRYETALAFAEDLHRVRDGDTIEARPTRWPVKAARWVRRHPARTLAGLLLLVTLAAVPLAKSAWERRAADAVAARRALIEAELEGGFLRTEARDVEEAREHFESVLGLDPDNVESVAGLALLAIEAERYAEALQILEDNERLRAPAPELDLIRSEALSLMGREEESRLLEQRVPEPQTPLGHFLAGKRLITRGHGLARRWAESEPTFERAQSHLARCVVLSSVHRPLYWHELAHAAKHTGSREIIEMVAARMGRSDAGARDLFFAGFAHLNVDAAKAATYLSRAITEELEPEMLRVMRSNLAQALGSQGRHGQARELLEQNLADHPGDPTSQLELGRALLELGQVAEGRACLEKARTAEADVWLTAGSDLARSLQRSGDWRAAEQLYVELCERAPENPMLWYRLGHARARLRDAEGGARAYRRALELAATPELRAQILNNLGILALESGKVTEAEKLFLRARSEDPGLVRARANLRQIYNRRGEHRRVLEAAAELVRMYPERPDLWLELAAFHLDLPGGSLDVLDFAATEAIARSDDTDYRPHMLLGWSACRGGDYEEATRQAEAALERIKDDHPQAAVARRAIQKLQRAIRRERQD